jgi:AbiU2
MAIQVRDSAELQRLLKALASELVDANIFFRLHVDLVKATGEFADEMNQAWTFWDRTLAAHLDTAVFRLCKIFDQDDRNLGLRGLLETVRANPHLFSAKEFAKRVEARPAGELLAADPPVLDRAQLDRDIAYATRANNPRVERLIAVRHNFYSHRNAADVVADRSVGAEYPISRDDVAELLRAGMEIVNRYSIAFEAHAYSAKMIGHDDYLSVLKSVRERLARQRKDLEDEFRRHGIDPGQL